ncbi:MAG: 1-acyl-sn-glycerol-3-phosphate acyltransferase [Gammaproteobacteria bacterium]|nr:1-acyl-sn-glycerol-3-phosphate acyltransferase [Gammaproteobacteria bacterium]
MDEFEDIRPYRDDEVRPVVDRLLQDNDLSSALAKFRHPLLYTFFPGWVTKKAHAILSEEIAHVQTIHDVQKIIEKYLDALIESTTTSLTSEGLESLDTTEPYLFMSNHRDITMDPALCNYMIYHHGLETLQIAIGDNLLQRLFLTDLMKLNKSFIVKRSVKGRDLLKASKQLSAYIHHCLKNGENVWIAQREGRAKDGIDKTESAIIKMLHMADRESTLKLTLQESITSLNIVPVTISYEFDPCDRAKAEELHTIDTTGKFEKDENSDVRSILAGMIGDKGDVHVAYGEKIQFSDAVTAEGVAREIDKQIIRNYKLHAVNYAAMELVQDDFMDFSTVPELLQISLAEFNSKRRVIKSRLGKMPKALQPYVLNMYANPVIRKSEIGAT